MSLFDWFDDRTGYRTWARKWRDHPIDGPPTWTSAIGAAILACLALELTTGISLMTVYSADARSAWASVHFIQHKMPYGWLVRGLHHSTADVLICLLTVWVLLLVMRGAYRRPHEVAFWIALAYVPLTLAACITGGLLPFDQLGYWARSVELNIAAMGPGGSSIVRLATGGGEIGTLALTRFQTLHVLVLPVVVGLMWIARRSIQKKHAYASGNARRYFPGQFARDIAFACLAVAVVAIDVKRRHGVPIGHPADPVSDYPARPEWFLLWMFELRHRMPKPLEFWGTALIPPMLGVALAMLPWIDRREATDTKGPAFRLRALVVLLGVFGVVGGLEYAGMRRDARDADLHKSLAKWNARAEKADALAMNGVPPDGPLSMLEHDPELRGEALFVHHCATCHLLQDYGDPKKHNAPTLDGWSTEAWITAMMHEPDTDGRFANTPYKEQMPSMDVPPKDNKGDFTPMSKDDMRAAAAFLASQSDEPGESPEKGAARKDKALVEAGEKIVRDRCTSCHLFGGEGDDNGQNLAPELSGYGSFAWVRAQISNPATKTSYREGALAVELKGHMPRFDDDLSAADLDLLTRWLRTRARSTTPR
jgi:ubiquinol-cytochrome c reductase cytochrome b subunit